MARGSGNGQREPQLCNILLPAGLSMQRDENLSFYQEHSSLAMIYAFLGLCQPSPGCCHIFHLSFCKWKLSLHRGNPILNADFSQLFWLFTRVCA